MNLLAKLGLVFVLVASCRKPSGTRRERVSVKRR
jgi:hypothetical protein